MPPTNLSKAQLDDLRELWEALEAGLTSVGDKGKISEAMEVRGLAEKTIKVCRSSLVLITLNRSCEICSLVMQPKLPIVKCKCNTANLS